MRKNLSGDVLSSGLLPFNIGIKRGLAAEL